MANVDSLRYDIVYFSSEEDPFNISELLRTDDDAAPMRGWQTAKDAKFPQTLVLRFDGEAALSQLQVLSHESKIASKIEVRVFSLENDLKQAVQPPSYKRVKFSKLGSVTFNSNEKSKFRSKERKTIHLSASAYYVKIVFHKPHENQLNTHHQVGVYKIVCIGSLSLKFPRHADAAVQAPQPLAATHIALPPLPAASHLLQHGWVGAGGSEDGGDAGGANDIGPHLGSKLPPIHQQTQQMSEQRHDSPHRYTFRSNRIVEFEQFYLRKIQDIAVMKLRAIQTENFEGAREFRDQLRYLEEYSQKIYALEAVKVRAIYDEDFDEAKEAKKQMDELVKAALQLSTPRPGPQQQQLRAGNGGCSPPPNDTAPGTKPAHLLTKPIDDQPVHSKYAMKMARKADGSDEYVDAAPDTAGDGPDDASAGNAQTSGDGGLVEDWSGCPIWEQPIMKAFQDACPDEELPSREPSNRPDAAGLHATVGRFATACLLSKRWKLRESMLKIFTEKLVTLVPASHAPRSSVIVALLRLLDQKGSGLQDSSLAVVVASCGFVRAVLAGAFDGAVPAQFLPSLTTLLPRVFFRLTETTARVRDEATNTIDAYAACADFGVERVLAALAADPVDQDKRRINPVVPKLHVTRLALAARLVQQFKPNVNTAVFDSFMHRWLVPCLAHQGADVREAAQRVVQILEGSHVLDFSKYQAGNVAPSPLPGSKRKPGKLSKLQPADGFSAPNV